MAGAAAGWNCLMRFSLNTLQTYLIVCEMMVFQKYIVSRRKDSIHNHSSSKKSHQLVCVCPSGLFDIQAGIRSTGSFCALLRRGSADDCWYSVYAACDSRRRFGFVVTLLASSVAKCASLCRHWHWVPREIWEQRMALP